MTDDFYENAFTVIAVIAVLVAATFILLFPQAFEFTVYRLLRQRSKPFAALIGFLLPLILYYLFFKYFWYDGLAQQTAADNPSGEGDLVIPALIGYGLILNVGCGLSLYVYLYIKSVAADKAQNPATSD